MLTCKWVLVTFLLSLQWCIILVCDNLWHPVEVLPVLSGRLDCSDWGYLEPYVCHPGLSSLRVKPPGLWLTRGQLHASCPSCCNVVGHGSLLLLGLSLMLALAAAGVVGSL